MSASSSLSTVRARLDELAASAESLRAYRAEVLNVLGTLVSFDAAVFHALSPRVPLETGVFLGLDMNAVVNSLSRWDDLGVELGSLRELANARLVATDRDAFPLGSRRRARFERHVTRPFGMRSLCVIHLIVRDSVRAVIMLLSQKARPFSPSIIATLRQLAPSIAVADTLHGQMDGVSSAYRPRGVICSDQRLTPRQRDIVEYVAMGHTNAAIAAALKLSPHTTRNHLAHIFSRLGAANRADLVRLAIIAPKSEAAGQ